MPSVNWEQKHLSFKDTRFIIEAIDHLIKEYNERLLAIEEKEEDEDEASELGNDFMFLESLRTELEESSSQGQTLKLPETSNGSSQGQERMSLDELVKPVLQLSINERLLLVEAITQSIRQEKTSMPSVTMQK